ncbi:hypothetical protein LCER1_G000229 [Lachnellula cervina]|uniref:Uncharacterized protein n=1 Tax=Lachnellula cervina TaxID=1316786 RepID=A0A7D8UY66_9HELO|nr:hypothetical protein LCER1_G000229 [Lachnellula cervina]
MLFNENPNRKLSRILLPKWHICLRLHQTLYKMSMKFVPGSAAQARRTQQAFLEIERDEKVGPQAPTNDRRRKRARYDSTDEEDEVSTHHATEVAKRITNREPYEADNKRAYAAGLSYESGKGAANSRVQLPVAATLLLKSETRRNQQRLFSRHLARSFKVNSSVSANSGNSVVAPFSNRMSGHVGDIRPVLKQKPSFDFRLRASSSIVTRNSSFSLSARDRGLFDITILIAPLLYILNTPTSPPQHTPTPHSLASTHKNLAPSHTHTNNETLAPGPRIPINQRITPKTLQIQLHIPFSLSSVTFFPKNCKSVSTWGLVEAWGVDMLLVVYCSGCFARGQLIG